MKNWMIFLLFLSSLSSCFADTSTDSTGSTDTTNATATSTPTPPPAALTTLSKDQLLKQPQSAIDAEIFRIQQALSADQLSLVYYQKLNAAYCPLLQKISSQCPAAAYIGINYGLNDLNCTSTPPPSPTIVVSLQNMGGNAFYLRANQTYETEVFSEATQNVLFSSTDGALSTPPRFIDLTTLSIITVNGSKKDKGFPTQRPSNLAIQITINGTLLLPQLSLIPSNTRNDFFTYQISPDAIPTLRKRVGCYIEAKDITNAQQSAQE